MTTLRQWLGSIKYHDVRHVESLAPVRLPHGGRLRGWRVSRHLYMSRGKRFYLIQEYSTEPHETIEELKGEAVLGMITLASLQKLWNNATKRQRQRMPVVKERRRRVVESRALVSR